MVNYYACCGSNQRPCKLKDNELQCMLHKKPSNVCDQEDCLSKVLYSSKQCRHGHAAKVIDDAEEESNTVSTQPVLLTQEALLTLMSQQNKDKLPSARCEPLEFPKSIAEYQIYKKDVIRWSRVCGIPAALQGETILMKIPKTNVFKTQLDNALGGRCENNEEGVTLILNEMDRLLGTDSDLEDFSKVIKLLELRRAPAQNIVEFITKSAGAERLRKF